MPQPWVPLVLVVASLLVGCPQAALEQKTNRQRSRELLVEGLEAQRAGDEALAKERMERALEVDPLNGRARTALASLHAGKAGVVLSQLVDPIYKASEELDSPSNAILEDLQKAKAQELEEKFKATRTTPGAQGQTQAQAQSSLAEAQSVLREFGSALTQANLAVVVLNTIPIVSAESLVHLDAGLAVLRDESIAPSARDEETRLYLAILAAVRFVSDFRTLLGKTSFKVGDIEAFRTTLCTLPRSRLRASVVDMRRSLTHMEEGLTPSKDDPDTSKRRKRKRLQEFVSRMLMNEAIAKAEEIFKEASPHAKKSVAEELASLWCSLPKAVPTLPPVPSLKGLVPTALPQVTLPQTTPPPTP